MERVCHLLEPIHVSSSASKVYNCNDLTHPNILQLSKLELYGDYALITGATDGIGKEYAFQMAAKGKDLILISRSLQKLNAVAREIYLKYGTKIKVIDIDFSTTSDKEYMERIKKEIEGLNVGILVPNQFCF